VVSCASALTRRAQVHSFRGSLSSFGSSVLDCLFPQVCVGCGRIGDHICSQCATHLPLLVGPVCPACGQPQPSGMLCHSCASTRRSISAVRSVFRFEGTIRTAIHELKYRNLRAIAPALAEHLDEYLRSWQLDVDFLVPVPLRKKRLRERGYNQAELLTAALAGMCGVPMRKGSLRRTGGTMSQVRTRDAQERHRNVADAFTCPDASLSAKRILLIDDVCTTGATLEACATALRSAGVHEVLGLTVAREM